MVGSFGIDGNQAIIAAGQPFLAEAVDPRLNGVVNNQGIAG